jgi:hypothetical protein
VVEESNSNESESVVAPDQIDIVVDTTGFATIYVCKRPIAVANGLAILPDLSAELGLSKDAHKGLWFTLASNTIPPKFQPGPPERPPLLLPTPSPSPSPSPSGGKWCWRNTCIHAVQAEK